MEDKNTNSLFKVQEIRNLTASTYIVRFNRNDMKFVAGQHLSVGKANEPQAREYSIYSAETDPFLEILVKEVEDGTVSKQLKRMKVGDPLRVQGPMGFFKLDESKINNAPHLFIATGTGISPFHSFIMSYPKINYIVIHGVRTGDEGYERFHFDEDRYLLCTSRDNSGNFHGRSTSYLKTIKLDPKTQVYLCGNCDMIFEAYDILSEKGIPTENIHTEVYF